MELKKALCEAASKPVQEEVVVTFLSGRDVFVSIPTGEGKSLCYAVLPWTFDLLEGGGKVPLWLWCHP